ncbi:MAG: LacI family transcriptional regulator, partial [Treponema sp.]|nr:LacI family transcriptional regulator [Treponema sp.]
MKTAKSKNITMETIARKAGVSITTVSHVLNKTRHVNKETKDAVLQAIKALNYHSSRMEKPNNKGKTINIGVILADTREDFYAGIIKTIESMAADYGVSIIFCDSEVNPEKEEKNIAIMLERNVSGLLIAPVDADHAPRLLKTASIPIILIDRQYESHNLLFVGINNFRSSYMGTNYLLKKGAKKIGFIGYSGPVYTVRQRNLGYKAAFMESGGKPQILNLSYHKEDSFPLVKNFIISRELDGILCATSILCYELIEVVDTLDQEIQKKLKIMSYDDNRWLDYLKYPVSV